MKKFAKIMALSLVVVMAIAVLAACGGSWSDKPAEAKKQAEDKGYTVTYFNDSSDEPDVDGQIGALEATKKGSSSTSNVTIWFYDSAAHAQEAFEQVESMLELEAAAVRALGGKASYEVKGSKIVYEETLKGLSAIFG